MEMKQKGEKGEKKKTKAFKPDSKQNVSLWQHGCN